MKKSAKSLLIFKDLLLTKRLRYLLHLAVGLGILLFATETLISKLLQIVFAKANVIGQEFSGNSAVLLGLSMGSLFGLLLIAGLMRGAIDYFQTYLIGAAYDFSLSYTRKRLLAKFLHKDVLTDSKLLYEASEKSLVACNLASYTYAIAINGVAVFFLLGWLIYLSPILSALLIFSAIVLTPVFMGLGRISRRVGGQIDDQAKDLLNQVGRVGRNSMLIKIYGTELFEQNRFDEVLGRYLRNSLKFRRLLGLSTALPRVVGIFLAIVFIWLALSTSLVPSAELMVYLYALLRIANYASQTLVNIGYVKFIATRVDELTLNDSLSSPKESNGLISNINKIECVAGESISIVAKNIGFSYPNHRNLISSLSFEVRANTVFALTGRSGSGKSTVLKLLLGLQAPTKGQIEVHFSGGIYPASEAREIFNRYCGYVGPATEAFDGTLRENLLYGCEGKSDEEILAALRLAECGFIQTTGELQENLNSLTQRFSTGELQRMALARALLREPKILVLDEPTANLDLETETEILRTISKLKAKMTVIFVTHRKDMLNFADHVLDLDTENAKVSLKQAN